MPYWLKNPAHGVMPVYELSEVERHKQWGWELMNHGPSPMREHVASVEPVKSEPVVEASIKRKPGRPPKAK